MTRVNTSTFIARAGGKVPGTTTLDGRTVLKCGNPRIPAHYIEKGERYRFFSPGFRGRKQVRCMRSECSPRGSELDASLFSAVLAAQEAANDNLSALDLTQDPDSTVSDVQNAIEDVRSAIEEVAGQYRDAAEAMGAAGTTQEEWADNLEGAEVMSWEAGDQDSFEEDPDANACEVHADQESADAKAAEDAAPGEEPEEVDLDSARQDCPDCALRREDAIEEWARGLVDAAQEVMADVSKE